MNEETKIKPAEIIPYLNLLALDIHSTAVSKGWWERERHPGEIVANIHGEVSELWEYIRHHNPKSDHIPEFTGVEEEIADIIIRVLDYAHANKFRIGEAILAKMEYNKTRPLKHGGKAF